MKLRYLLPFFLIFNAKAQFKIEANTDELDLKSKYIDVSARDTFGLKNLVSTKGIVKLKYDNNSIYFNRNGLLNHSYGANANLDILECYYNNSQQNIKTENSSSQNSSIGQINTKTTLLNEDNANDFGIKLNYNDYFISYENAKNKNKIDGETLIEIDEDQELVKYQFDFNNSNNVYGLGFKYGFAKFIINDQDNNKFNDYFIKANYKGINFYYAKEIIALFNFDLFENININITYDKNLKVNLSTNNYSELNNKTFEKDLENRLRIVPRIYDSGLEILREYTKDMFFTDLFSFYLDKDNFEANINFDYLLAHYSKESKKIGVKYKSALLTYDFKNYEFKFGLLLN